MRAQAERGRGSVPGLHTPATPVARLPDAAAGPARDLLWALLVLVLAAGLAVGGWWLWHSPSAPEAVTTPPAPVVAATPAAALPATPAPPIAATVPAAQPAPAVPPPRPSRPAARAADAGPTPAARPAPPRAAPPAAPKSAEAQSAPVYAQADLPPAVREQLPTLQLAGVTYSSNPKYRMVIVNGQVLHEGDQAAPGLVLERIEPGRTVWAFRGYRYALPAQ